MSISPPIDCKISIPLVVQENLPEQFHRFDEDSVLAIRAALAARRPLLVRGEPGVGKTQLAAAAAKVLGRPLVQKVVDSRTESRDLMYEFDAIMRLADAQIAAVTAGECATDGSDRTGMIRKRLEIRNYVRPGPLWWAFDWTDASDQAEQTNSPIPTLLAHEDPRNGCVLLIDEIDKAETDVPNGLLEALGSGRFTPLGQTAAVQIRGEPPLVIITTNEERTLPPAFTRRCLVLELTLPGTENDLVDLLVSRAWTHFNGREGASDDLFRAAAELLVQDRRDARDRNVLPLPGQAEYLDLLRAAFSLAKGTGEGPKAILQKIAQFAVKKFGRGEL